MTRRLFRRILLAVPVLALTLTGCHRPAPSPATGSAPNSHFIRGTVISLDLPAQSLDLNNEDIPGFMPAMTMTYKVTNPAALTEIHPGDKITATLLDDPSSNGPTNLRLDEIVIIAQARPDYKPAVVYHVPTPGDTVPDFKLLNQSGHIIHLDQFRGKTYAMTFFYTRCQLSAFCPRMGRNFAAIDAALAKNPQLYAHTHLLSVSFDPTHDTPKVLRSYGGGVTGRFTNETFTHWDFAAPQGPELLAMEKWFAVGVTPGPSGTLAHSLSTTIVGPDGKVVAFYPTNTWTVSQALTAIQTAAKK